MTSNLTLFRVPARELSSRAGPFRRRVARRPSTFGPSLFGFDRFFADFEKGFARPIASETECEFHPHVAVEESAAEYRLVAELPGVDAADLDISIEGEVLSLKGSRKLAFGTGSVDSEDSEDAATSGDDQSAVEAASTFERNIRFGAEIDADGIHASCKHGMLVVTVPKRTAPEPQVISVPIETA